MVFFGVILLAVALIFSLAVASGRKGRFTPRFIPGPPAEVWSFTWDHYDWGIDVPFQDGKMWLWTAGPKAHQFLYDLKSNAIAGEMVPPAMPVLSTKDGSRILVFGPEPSLSALRRSIWNLVRKPFGARASPMLSREEAFWLLDTRNNAARRLGILSQTPGTGSQWRPSPDCTRGYTAPSYGLGRMIFLCDLNQSTFKQLNCAGYVAGWWDDSHLLVHAGTNRFVLFDIFTSQSSDLFNRTNIESLLLREDLTNDPRGLGVFANWNGRAYDFYFAPEGSRQGLQYQDAFLMKADRTNSSLQLLYREFNFRWSGHLDETGTQYLYPGEAGQPGRGGDGSVYWRDLTTGKTTTLVPPDNSGQYSIPRQFGNEVIYFRNRQLRRIGTDGQNDAPLLTPSP